MTHHHFNIYDAEKCGVHAAILLQHFRFWIQKNEADERNYFEGQYWTYCTIGSLAKILPYFSEKQVRTAIKKLLDAGLIVKGCYNEDKRDRTMWYAVVDPSTSDNQKSDDLDMPKREATNAQTGKCIYKETDKSKTDKKINKKKKSKLLSDTTPQDLAEWIRQQEKQGITFTFDTLLELQKCKEHFKGKPRTIKTAHTWFLQAQQWRNERIGGNAPQKSDKLLDEPPRRVVDAGDDDAYDKMMQEWGA
ncbi:MAG: DUF4423 domain-containing protein [Pseudomonadales bacterium]|nr:DUF4423 domain-containing protein [Pseudomonadales bacterium]